MKEPFKFKQNSSKTKKKFLWKVGKLFLYFLKVLTSSLILLYKKRPSFRHGKALGGWHYENHQGHTWLCLVQAPYSGNSLPLGPYQPCNYPYDLPFPFTMRLVAQKVTIIPFKNHHWNFDPSTNNDPNFKHCSWCVVLNWKGLCALHLRKTTSQTTFHIDRLTMNVTFTIWRLLWSLFWMKTKINIYDIVLD